MSNSVITIDGTYGEGGGQILRSSLALSLVTGQPFCIANIRAGRKRPGLMRQHLTAVQAAAEIAQAEVSGAGIGSQQLTFEPNRVVPGDYTFRIGTAGSTMLVLQTVLPALVLAAGPSTLVLQGGTHNPFAPPFDFLARTFLPLCNRMGPHVTAVLDRPGFYPVGGGQCRVTIEPAAALHPLDLRARGAIVAQRARAVVANLPRHIAERELNVIQQEMAWPAEWLDIESVTNAPGPGNIVTIDIETEHLTEVFTGFGQRGVSAETVASRVVRAAQRYLRANVAVGIYLADQLLLPLVLAGSGVFSTLPLSQHTRTNIHVIQQFLDVTIDTSQLDPQAWLVRIER